MSQWVIAPLLLPLLSGVLLLFFSGERSLQRQRIASLISMGLMVLLALGLLMSSNDGIHRVYALGNWIAPFGIVLVLDRLAALMLLLTDLLALAALLYAVLHDEDTRGAYFHPLFMLQLFGLHGAFLTGDVFNLFVFFEVLLLASYALLLHGGGRLRTKAGLHFVVINLVGSTLFLFAVGALYGVLGTLNLADMAARIAHAPTEDHAVIAGAGLLLFAVFALKAALFPFYLWLPAAYAHTSAAVAALFAIMTKVGLYAMLRVHGTLFGGEAGELASLVQPWLMGLGWVTLGLAAFGVMAARFLREQAAYLVLASVGMIALGLSLPGSQALSATLYYLMHSTLLAGGFFLLADLIRQQRDATEDRFEEGHIASNLVLLGSLYFVFAIALAGMPPLSGFFGKLMILSAGMKTANMPVHLAVVLVASFIIIVALAKTGSLLFYRQASLTPTHDHATAPRPPSPPSLGTLAIVIALLAASPLVVLFAHPLNTWLEQTAVQTLDHRAYMDAVFQLKAIGTRP